MQKARRILVVAAAFAVLFVALPALAQQGAAVQQGELVRVDTSARTITISTPQDTPEGDMQFRYTDQTKVVGADGQVAGLATRSGARVSITYVQRNNENVATEIQVHAAGREKEPEREYGY